ncbi:MAG: SpoIIE family protein phosphatase [Actinomycetota bacterium]|nr:SpoIIE family protein phosphatase [Actinomycetota bacterium]
MLVAGARDEQHLQLSRELDLRSVLVVPLTARGRSLGVITMLRTGSSRVYTPADLAIAEDLGRRAGIAVDNARLHGQTVNVALQLQRAVLPDDLSAIPGWTIATHYSPSDNAEVGGDFYDAILLPNGQLAVYIGDVMGHGLQAAAAMAQMCASIRAFLTIDPAPHAVMSRLDVMFDRLGLTQLVTLFSGCLDAQGGQLSYVNAGHYPPLLVARVGEVRFVESDPQRPLGAGADRRSVTVSVRAGDDSLLLYTDGLVERRGEHIDLGLDQLRRRATGLASGPLEASLEKLVADMRETDGVDDVTAMAVRADPCRDLPSST